MSSLVTLPCITLLKSSQVLDYLAVHPDNRGQRVGSMLVESGIEEARKMSLDVFVHGMKAGLGVYKRAGFKLVDQMILDDSPYGGKGEYGSYFLVKEAEEKQAGQIAESYPYKSNPY